MSFLDFLPFVITASGIYFIIKLKAFFVFRPIAVGKKLSVILKEKSSFNSLALALAGTLGVGNIVGVAYGITVGGAGSIFWIFVSGIFASVIKYCESLLAADSKVDGHGGMAYVIQKSFSKSGRFASILYASLCILLSLTMGSALQAATFVECAEYSFGTNPYFLSVFFCTSVTAAVAFGTKKIERITAFIIPASVAIYIFMCLAIIILNLSKIPTVLFSIISDAFSFNSAAGGVSAFLFSKAIKEGYARGLLSNEAGAGTSSMAQSRSNAAHPCEVGLLGICEVAFDTTLLCTLTGIAIIISVPDISVCKTGIGLVLFAVECGLGKFFCVITMLLIFLFAYSTVVCWYFYGREALRFLLGEGNMPIYTLLFLLSNALGASVSEEFLIFSSDFILFLMTLISLAALIKNSERIMYLSEDYGLLKHSDMRKGRKSLFGNARKRCG